MACDRTAITGLALCALTDGATAQTRRPTPPRPAPTAVTKAAALDCPHVLGVGVATQPYVL